MQLNSLSDLLTLYVRERDPSSDMERQLGVVIRSFQHFAKTDQLDAIDREILLDWRNYLLKERKVSISTWNNYLRHLKVLLNLAQDHGWDTGNRLRGVKRLPEQRKQKRTVSDEAIRKVLHFFQQPEQQNMPGWFWELVCKALYYSGIRRRQLVGLHWSDIDWEAGSIRLRAESSKTRIEWLIPMVPPMRAVLEEVRKQTEKRLRRRCLPEEQVFNITLFNPNYASKRMTVDHVSAAFRRVRETTGIDVSAHRFRHTFASQLAKQGRLRELQQILGHTDVRTTLGYVQPDLNGMNELMSSLSVL